ncbi:MOSC domain-containing protein [Pseudomonas stutzeri]|uniref:MOSC domain-containing protein n=2 Tax=Stutzerimonas stutzeri TaxID=316 RepID=A0A2N8S3B9_STUST|nr:MOSC domain-containing protein [Stutzerimonas stutzeri]MCQ4296573.1 MOSC domain-containing protein [Stutzerimonas stutzeri]PNF81121.1 MOSC domain-containing protein [Stutzerimonas stutzeri]
MAATAPQIWAVSGPLLCERFSPLPGSSKATAMDKHASAGPLWLGMAGLQGDRVADQRFHGGPERTLCHYPTQHYVYWAQRFAQLRTRLGLGAFGENLGSEQLDEAQVCIGDRLRWGGALIEVSQPRSPCIRLDSRHGVRGLARELSASGRIGWLYRTIEEGHVRPGDALQLLERPHPGVSVTHLWRCFLDPGLADETLLQLAELPRLATHYRAIFRQRYDARRGHRDQRDLFD